jgi:hypothetical protein
LSEAILNQWLKVVLGSKHSISDWIKTFILDRKAFILFLGRDRSALCN